jgi:PAS domain S-box-containing protein
MEEAQANEAIWRRILIEQSRDGIVILDHNGKVYEANRCFCEMLGYSPEEMSKLYIWDWDTESTRENLMMKINNINEAGDNFEANYRRKDSTIISVDISTNGATFAGEKLILYVCRDITERKRIEDKLRKSEEKYRMIFASANDVIILTDKKGNIVDVNEKISNIGGYHRDDLIGKSFKTLTKVMPKKSIAIVAKNYALRLLGIHVPAYEVEMYHSDGQLINIEINAVAVKEDNKIIGTLATLRDVTERKKSESALKYERELIEQIIATIPNAVIVIDDDTRVLLANNTFYKSFHLKKKDVEDRPINESIRIEELDHTLKTLVKTKQNNTSLEIRYPVNNAPRILATGIIKMENQRYLIIMNDITEEREKQERLYLTDRLASVGEMASGVAHELNNPLTSVIGLSSFLMKQEMPSDTHEDLAAINSEAQRCAVIVKNLLTFARKHVPKREQIQLTKILEDVLKLRAYEQRGQNINIETYFAPDLPDVLADYFQIQQVFLNIILNAEAAMVEAHSRGTLKIKMERLGNHVEISFADDGPGILQENMGLIFNPFFTTKEVGKGTGLGLSICYGIITSHGGKIYAKSTPGSGATFVIELPCA